MTTMVRGKWVIAGAGDAVLSGGAVVVEGETIAEVGAWEELRARHPDADVLGSDQAVVLPRPVCSARSGPFPAPRPSLTG